MWDGGGLSSFLPLCLLTHLLQCTEKHTRTHKVIQIRFFLNFCADCSDFQTPSSAKTAVSENLSAMKLHHSVVKVTVFKSSVFIFMILR